MYYRKGNDMFKKFLFILGMGIILSACGRQFPNMTEQKLGYTTIDEMVEKYGQPDYYWQDEYVILAQYCKIKTGMFSDIHAFQVYAFVDSVLVDTATYENKISASYDSCINARAGYEIHLPKLNKLGYRIVQKDN